MATDSPSMGSGSSWTLAGVALLLVGLLAGAAFWQGGNRFLALLLLLAGIVGGPIVIGVFSRE